MCDHRNRCTCGSNNIMEIPSVRNPQIIIAYECNVCGTFVLTPDFDAVRHDLTLELAYGR
jgi:hypothetical protein